MMTVLLLLVLQLGVLIAEFSPYKDNGGTVVGLAGRDYVLFAADTRLKDEYTISTRNITRLFEIDDGLLFSGSKCWTDILALSKELRNAAMVYEWEHKMKLAILPLSYLLTSKLYTRRFFPYYTFSLIGGIDAHGNHIAAFQFLIRNNDSYCVYTIYLGTGAVYRYDAVGSSERVAAACSGEGEKMIQPILDELTNMEEDNALWEIAGEGENAFISTTISDVRQDIGTEHESDELLGITGPRRSHCVGLDCDKACDVVVRAFQAAAEREISVGDGLDVWILKKNKNLNSKFGTPLDDTNQYLLEKRRFTLPSH